MFLLLYEFEAIQDGTSAKYCRTYVYVKLGITNWKSPKSSSRIFILVNVPFSLYSCKTLYAVTYVSTYKVHRDSEGLYVCDKQQRKYPSLL